MSNKRRQLVQNRYASPDPAMRGGMGDAPSFMPPIAFRARNIWQIIGNRASITGLLVADYGPRVGENIAVMAGWLQSRQPVFDEHIDHDIGHALRSFLRPLGGNNA